MKQLIIEVTPAGELTIEALGYKGPACERATAAMEKALGLVKHRRKKPEYHAAVTITNQQTIG